MHRYWAVLLLTFLCSATAWAQSSSATGQGSPQLSGDYEVLSLVWRPAFCALPENTHRKECQPGATSTQLMLDGLSLFWDRNGDGKRNDDDRYCIDDPALRTDIIAKDKAAQRDWSGLPEAPISESTRDALTAVMPRVLSGLERHEWLKHGTCSGLSADGFFALTVKMTRDVLDNAFGEAIIENAGEVVERKILRAAFRLRYGKARLPALTLNCVKGPDGRDMLLEARIRVTREYADRGIVGSSLDAREIGKKGTCGKEFLIPAP
ncbi:MAG: ribonuclease T2 family protein [Pseudomonadota bacterium]